MNKKQINSAVLLKGMNVNISAFLRLFAYHPDRSEQHTKKGPGRKHKQGKASYV